MKKADSSEMLVTTRQNNATSEKTDQSNTRILYAEALTFHISYSFLTIRLPLCWRI